MPTYNQIKDFISKCRVSASFFMEHCCRIKHPSRGTIPFNLFKYQMAALGTIRKNRYSIFRKCRQCGISTLSGAYALWVGMFFKDKTILIVSKRDDDAKRFLHDNVKLIYDNLPDWMKEVWKKTKDSEHEIGFANGSVIRSLTSSPDTLRSNASSLNIIDESGFMPDMETMWSGGWSTLQHGGSVIIISTPNGIGNWYWDKWTEAEAGDSIWSPIHIKWWDMDWVMEYDDPISGSHIRIAPTDGLRRCTTKEDIEKWGDYYSPWLEKEYQGLRARGEAHLFRQEVLGEFIGSGGTLLDTSTLYAVGRSVNAAPHPKTFQEPVLWVNARTDDKKYLDFSGTDGEGLLVWNEPDVGRIPKYKNGRVLDPGEPGHTYVMGVDIATGENNDYSAIEVFDINTMEQVAEYMGHIEVRPFAHMVDWLGRWYNTALIIPERTGIGIPFIQDLQDCMYPRIWRPKKNSNGQVTFGNYGFSTTPQSKPTLNKALLQFVTDNETSYVIKSLRLYKQFQIYIRQRNKQGLDTKKTGAQTGRGNHDDLVIAAGLSFIALPDVVDIDPMGLMPIRGKIIEQQKLVMPAQQDTDKLAEQKRMAAQQQYGAMMPLTYNSMQKGALSNAEQLANFTNSMISKPPSIPASMHRQKHLLKYPHKNQDIIVKPGINKKGSQD